MSTVIFVHGTGVREPAFTKLFERVRGELHRRRPAVDVQPCFWGGTKGARLWHDGGSVPAYDTTRGIDPGPEDEELAAWDWLYQDPLWELKALAMAGPTGGEQPPWQALPGDALDASVQLLAPSGELAAAIDAAGLTETFQSARVAIATSLPYRRAVAAASPATA